MISSSRKYCNKCLIIIRDERKTTSKERKKVYFRSAVKTYLKQLKLRSILYKGGKCQICGYSAYEGSLHFHHVHDIDKSFNISGKSISFDRLQPELDKCILVCSNCHGEIHGGLINQLLIEKIWKMVGPDGTTPSSEV